MLRVPQSWSSRSDTASTGGEQAAAPLQQSEEGHGRGLWNAQRPTWDCGFIIGFIIGVKKARNGGPYTRARSSGTLQI